MLKVATKALEIADVQETTYLITLRRATIVLLEFLIALF